MSTAVMTLQQHRPLPAKKMVMMLSPPHDVQPQLVQPSNGACVIVSNGCSPPHFTNLDAPKHAVKPALHKVSRVGGGVVQKAVPAPRTSVVVAATPASAAAADALRCKRRIQFNQGGGVAAPAAPGAFHQTASVARRNARERNRVKQVNNGFATLRSHIPPAIAAALQEAMGTAEQRPPSGRSSAKDKEAAKKLSKVETLRMAVEYIRSLQDLLQNNENAAPAAAVKTEAAEVMTDSTTHGSFDSDYDAALALSHYSMAAETSSPPSSTTPHVAGTTTYVPHHHHQSHHQQQHQQQHHHFVTMSPPCSDAGSSPTPSYVSDGSVGPSSTGYAPTAFVPAVCRPTSLAVHSPATPPDSTVYEPMSPEDEELLDVISWWQQSN